MAARIKVVDTLNKFHFEARTNKQPYHLQGTNAFEDSPNRARRRDIAQSAKLRSVALQFWTTSGLREDQVMPKETYAFIHRRISQALAPELSEAEAAEAASEDWEEDLQGETEMRFAQYACGLFGVADMWTESVDELE